MEERGGLDCVDNVYVNGIFDTEEYLFLLTYVALSSSVLDGSKCESLGPPPKGEEYLRSY